ncbi:PQQ-binding-like beta-propeller repeat protein [Streptomyces sp. PA5.6]|uniref:outer membrane protein assembly factor BamB family protein n=1 Tax=Streptomyces sp. PA5.6 TaxID=3035651 RepID=UPI003904DF70
MPTTYTPDAIAGSALLVGDSKTKLVAYDARTGKELWRGTDDIDGTYPMTKDTLYVTVDHGELRCLEPDSGDRRWRFAPLGDDDVSGGPKRSMSAWAPTSTRCTTPMGKCAGGTAQRVTWP